MLHFIIEKLSDYPGLFLFGRSILEGDFKVIRRTIKEHLPRTAGQKVLDVACGPGAFSDLFDPDSYWGVDINEKYILYATRHYRGSFQVMDARRLDFEDSRFDQALVFGLLHHLNDEDVSAVIQGLARVLKPNGRAIVIEDIPTESKLNLVGHVLHWMENGHYIRPAEHYRRLLQRRFRIGEEQIFRSGVCDYYMASLTKNEDSHRAAEAGR